MTIHNVRLSEDVEKESTGGPTFFTTVFKLANGAEARNQNWLKSKCVYDISYGAQRSSDGYAEVLAFFYARRGRLFAFRFKDWSDYSAVATAQGTGTGAQVAFPLIKTYADDILPYSRPILLPVDGTLAVYINGSVASGWTFANGIVTFGSAPALGAVITADFEFDVPVRFDNDALSLSVETWDAASVQSITLTEVVS